MEKKKKASAEVVKRKARKDEQRQQQHGELAEEGSQNVPTSLKAKSNEQRKDRELS